MRTFQKFMVGAICGGTWFAAIGAGCGGTSEVKDAGPDQTVMMMETGPDVAMMDVKDAGCGVDADLFNIDFGDAGWPADSGIDGGSPQICWSCVKTKCMMYISDCNNNCACKAAVTQFLDCVRMNGLQQSCAGSLLSFDPNFAISFGGCVVSQCNGPCPSPRFGDGGSDASNDAADGGG